MKHTFQALGSTDYQWETTVLGNVAIYYKGAWINTVARYVEALQFVKQHSENSK